MITLEEYKKALGQPTDDVTDEELQEIIKAQDSIAEMFYVLWSEKKNKKDIVETQCQELMKTETQLSTVV